MFNLNAPYYYICVSSWSVPHNNHKKLEKLYLQQASEYLNNTITKFKINNAMIDKLDDNKYKVLPDGLRDPIVISVQFDTNEFKNDYSHYWYKLTADINKEEDNTSNIAQYALDNHDCICINSLIDRGNIVTTKLLFNEITNPLIIEDSFNELDPVEIKLGDLLYKCITSNLYIPNTCNNLHIFALGEIRYSKQQLLKLINEYYLTVDCIVTVSKNKYLVVIENEQYDVLFDAYSSCLGKVYKIKYVNFKYATIEYIRL